MGKLYQIAWRGSKFVSGLVRTFLTLWVARGGFADGEGASGFGFRAPAKLHAEVGFDRILFRFECRKPTKD
jgi:hypothetical protein